MERVIVKKEKAELNAKSDLEYWLSRPVAERFEAVEFLRSQMYETAPRLQRVFKVIQCEKR